MHSDSSVLLAFLGKIRKRLVGLEKCLRHVYAGGKSVSAALLTPASPSPAGNSLKDESLYSSSTQKQSFDSLTLSRGQSLRRPSSHVAAGMQESFLTTSTPLRAYAALYHNPNHHHLHHHHQHQHLHHHHHHQQHPGEKPPKTNVLQVSSTKPGCSELDLYTDERELQLNIFASSAPFDDPPSSPLENGVTPLENGPAPASDRSLSRISIQINRVGSLSGNGTSTSGLAERSDTLRLLCKPPRAKDGRIEILVRNRHRQRQRSRLKLWRFFQHERPLARQPQRNPSASSAVVHFYEQPQEVAERGDEVDEGDEELEHGAGIEDELEAYMREIKQREAIHR